MASRKCNAARAVRGHGGHSARSGLLGVNRREQRLAAHCEGLHSAHVRQYWLNVAEFSDRMGLHVAAAACRAKADQQDCGGIGGFAPDVGPVTASVPGDVLTLPLGRPGLVPEALARALACLGLSSGGAIDAKQSVSQSPPVLAPDKQPAAHPDSDIGLCGQVAKEYYSDSEGKSFNPIMSKAKYTSYEIRPKRQIPAHVLESRASQGRKLRALYRSLGWSRADCAKFLHITERCLRNWETGQHPVPFAAFKLLRLHLRYDLPGKDWEGWHIAAGKLWTPEGHGLNPHDAKWWSMLHRRAETGVLALRRLHDLRSGQREAGAEPVGAQAQRAPVGAALASPLPGAAGGVAATAAAGLVPYKTTRTKSPSKTIAASNYAIGCYQFRINQGGQHHG